MKTIKSSVVLVFFLGIGIAHAQTRLMPLPGDLSTKEKIEKHNSYFLPIYNFKENDRVASIGTSFGYREIVFSMETPKILFYLQDIQPHFLRPDFVEGFIFQCQKIYGRATKSEFRLSIGDSVSTKLPQIIFDKIIIENALHEFTYPNEMLTDILSKLSDNGYLFISEKIASKPNRKHKSCRGLLFMEHQLIDLLAKFDCKLIEKYQPYPREKRFFRV